MPMLKLRELCWASVTGVGEAEANTRARGVLVITRARVAGAKTRSTGVGATTKA
jgi:hypothetical protein